MWATWKIRNSLLYADTQLSREKLLRDMTEEVDQWFKLNDMPPQEIAERFRLQGCDGWSPPENEAVKCNIHANWRNTSLHSGMAWIARDRVGNVSHHARDAIVHAPTAS